MILNIWGHDFTLDIENKTLSYWEKTFSWTPRTYKEMKNLYEYDLWEHHDEDLYLMFREVYANNEDLEIFKENDIRYDITVFIPRLIWNELNKTHGHYHDFNDSWKRYNEVYEVVSWEALYLFQLDGEYFTKKVSEGESIEMKEFWHVSINISKTTPLIMANLVSNAFSSIYSDYNNNSWACVLIKDNFWEIIEEQNPLYENKFKRRDINTDFKKEESDIYKDFFKRPEHYKNILN